MLGGTTQVAGDQERGIALYFRSLELYEALGDEWGIVHLRHRVWTGARRERAGAHGWRRISRARGQSGSRMLEIEAIGGLAFVAHRGGEFDRAVELYRVQLEGARQLGFAWFIAIGGGNLAECEYEVGKLDEAEAAALDALAVAREIDDQRVTSWMLLVCAAIAAQRGERRARRPARRGGRGGACARRARLERRGL